jgi:HD-GYP domain-containing protein (c-di-GMP phosphodiesterase class II)
MRLAYLTAIPPEAELARDITSDGTIPLVRKGTKITASIAQRLMARGISAVWINDSLSDGIDPLEPLPPEVKAQSQRVLSKSLEVARTTVASQHGLPYATVNEMSRVADEISRALADCPAATIALTDLSSTDSYTHGHSLRVATVGLLMAHQIFREDGWVDWSGKVRRDRREERMATLGFGLVLHDIGNLAIPGEILNKPGQLDADEYAQVQKHPQAGLDILAASNLSPLAMAVIRDHHERVDGQGYPNGRSDTLHQFARIAAVAEVYDAIVSDRPYKPGAKPHVAVDIIRAGAGTQFDDRVVEHFCRIVMPYPIGGEVDLPDGRKGVVSAVEPELPYRPTVRVENPGGSFEEFVVDLTPDADRRAAA